MFRSITNRIKYLITKPLQIVSSQKTFSNSDLSAPTRVESEVCIQTADRPASKGTPEVFPAPEAAVIDRSSVLRFRRTNEEIRLGLSIEQAQAMRSPKTAKGKSPTHGKRGKDKAKRLKRTQQEIEAGLSIGQAAALRGTVLPKASKMHAFVERKAAPAKPTDLIETLTPKIQARARAVTRYRSSGGKGVIPPDLFDQIEKAVAAGKVTRCPPCTDSDGYNHLTQQEAK
ncbi:MAG: hypothetical protein JWP25_7590 [Bradyrhizobium sp.]|nr:hypothetical protein [Bradyrhizobium sp.]